MSEVFRRVWFEAPRSGPPVTLLELLAERLPASLDRPLGSRSPVTYQREFVDRYRPNDTFLLPEHLAQELFERGRLPGLGRVTP